MIGESSFERTTRINLIAKSLVKGLNEKVSELSFNISHSMISQEVTDEIKFMIF